MVVVDKPAFMRHHAAVWGRTEWAPENVLAVAYRGEKYGVAGHAHPSDAERLWSLIEGKASQGLTTYVTNGVRGTKPAAVGTAAEVTLIPALIVDIDVSDADHALGDGNPNHALARRIIAEAHAPTVKIFTGGGWHLWYVLEEPFDPHSEDGKLLLAKHEAYWLTMAARHNTNIDAGPLTAVAGAPRPAGSWNAKQDKPVSLYSAEGPTYAMKSMLGFYPDPAPKVSKFGGAGRSFSELEPRELDPSAKIGDRFALNFPVALLAQEAFGAYIGSDGEVTFPRSDGSHAAEANAHVYDDGDDAAPETLTVFGGRVQQDLGLTTTSHRWSSWDLLLNTVGGPRVAAGLLGRWENADAPGTWSEEFVDAIQAAFSTEVASAFAITQYAPPTPPPRRVVAPSRPAAQRPAVVVTPAEADAEASDQRILAALLPLSLSLSPEVVTVSAPVQTIATAIANREPGEFPMEGGKIAYTWTKGADGKPLHGIYRRHKDELTGVVTHRRMTSWVLFKNLEVERRTVGADGIELGSRETMVTLTLATADGRVKIMPGFSVAEAHSLKSAIDTMNFGVELPETDAALKAVANSVRVLGNAGGTEKVSEFGSTGWLRAETGHWAYLAPAGSITAAGATDEFAVGAPPHSEEGALTDAQRGYGWKELPATPAEVRATAASVPAFLALTPRTPAAFALLGGMFAAPLALASRSTIFVAGLPDSGKSKLAAAAQAFLTGDPFGASFTGGSVLEATAKGAALVCGWGRHSITFWDDFMIPEDEPAIAARMRTVVGVVMKAAYGGSDSGQKSTKDHGLTAIRSTDSLSVITGEALPEGTGVLSRAVSIQVTKGDVMLTPQGSAPFDLFRVNQASGAHAIYGRYVQWLAAQLERCGTLAKFRAEQATLRATVTPTSGRSAEAVAVVAVGWARFVEFATELGFRDLLPTDAYITATITDLAGANADLVIASNPAAVVVRAARDVVAGTVGHIELASGKPPIGPIGARLGWRWRADLSLQNIGRWEPTNLVIGSLSEDGEHVLLRSNAVNELKKRCGLAALPMTQLNGAFASLIVVGTEPGGRSPRSLGLDRARGYAVPAAMLDLEGLVMPAAPVESTDS
jgi:hypothetical protein